MFFTILPSDRYPIKRPFVPSSLSSMPAEGKTLQGRRVSAQGQIEKTVKRAAAIANSLSLLKERLLVEFGQSSHSFIAKAIDPMVQHANKIIAELCPEGAIPEAGVDSNVLGKAIESVGLYAQFNDEKKLRRKIVHETVYATHQAIEKDCEILSNYQQYFLQTELSMDPERDRLEIQLSDKLDVVFREFMKLKDREFASDDLRELFLWKSKIDAQRGALTEFGLLTIDSLLHHQTSIPHEDEEGSLLSQSPQKVFIEEMMERSQNLLLLVENGSHFDIRVFEELGVMIKELKIQACHIAPSVDGEFKDTFDVIQDTIRRLDLFMRQKKVM